MINKFPSFSKLELTHKEEVESITKHFTPYSDFNFVSLYTWDTDGSTSVALLNRNLVIQLPDYLTSEPVLSILGKENIDASLQILLETTDKLKLVPEDTVRAIKNPGLFLIEEDRDNYDYMYDLSEITNLAGKKFKKIRNKLNTFNVSNPDSITISNEPSLSESSKQEFLELFDEWAKTAKQSKEDSVAEKVAITRLLANASSLRLLFTNFRQGSRLVAFSISEVLENQYAMCHFEKGSPSLNNIYVYVAYEGAKALLAQGVKYANWEQDLGIQGLREAKSKWQPESFLKKYTVSSID